MSIENEKYEALEEATESTENWQDPSLPIANLALYYSSQEVVEWGAVAVFVAKAVASGVLSAIAGRVAGIVFDNLFGGGRDYARLNKSALAAINEIVKKNLSESLINDCDSRISQLKVRIQEYSNAPDSREDALLIAIDDSIKLTYDLQILGVLGIGSFMVAASLRLALLQERSIKFPGEIANIRDRIKEYTAYAQAIKEKLPREAAKVSVCACIAGPSIGGGGGGGGGGDPSPESLRILEKSGEIDKLEARRVPCFYVLGNEVRHFGVDRQNPLADCNRSSQESIQTQERQIKEQTSSIQAVIDEWQKILQNLPSA